MKNYLFLAGLFTVVGYIERDDKRNYYNHKVCAIDTKYATEIRIAAFVRRLRIFSAA